MTLSRTRGWVVSQFTWLQHPIGSLPAFTWAQHVSTIVGAVLVVTIALGRTPGSRG